ncbi:hypothetical protein [Corynebacterium renale]|uniref:Uncharacterized protein n=1 Tax=Corynebacterium renale TaxID=1724 RepID=A0A2A9DMG5_9CORY|nr:hypothetical protein [Corynebacterium renale]PFG27556.1 hypothetical protein ATK06_0626 [Corynebacterium renale]SQI23129.1 putative secreted protein [Corynebacterium renale]
MKKLLATVAAAALAFTATPAQAYTFHDTYPETPKLNPQLPIVHTTHGSDHIKANVLNARPVCNSGEDFRTVVYQASDNFTPAGTISTTNKTSSPIPLTQDLARTQSISLSIQGDRTNTTSVNLGGSVSEDGKSGSVGITKSIVEKIGAQFSYSLSWTAGQKIGPYEVPAGHTGEATFGFRTIHLDGTQQYCKPNGTWSNPTPWRVMAPVKNEVEVKVYDTLAGSWLGDTTPGTPDTPDTTSEPDTSVADPDVVDGPAEEPEIIPEPTLDPGDHEYDLEPYFTVAAGKASGFAGLVALRVKNVGTKQYYQDNLATRFRIDVHTDRGPEGVDRLITPGWFNGAYTRDLGFNKETSTRSFEVTLSNPVRPGQSQLVANLNFGDGNTSEGRLHNYITVTQIGRVAGDVSEYNDQNVDSREATVDHMKRKNKGIF